MKDYPPLQSSTHVDSIQDSGQRRTIMWSVCIALMAVIASVTGLNVAQPQLANDLNTSHHTVLWIINIYTITLSALLLPLGAVGDRYGRKSVFFIGLLIFGLANVAAAFAESSNSMFIARLFTGIGAAMIMPVTLSVITSTFPDHERSKAIGIWTAVAGGGGILGMFLSALLVDTIGWRWLFALPIFLVIVAALIGARVIPNTRRLFTHRFDYPGSVLSVIAVISIILFLHDGPNEGWLSLTSLVWLSLSVVSVTSFLYWEYRHPGPLLDIKLMKQPSLASGSLTILIWFGVQAGIFIVLYPFFQMVFGWSGLMATLGLMPLALLMMGASVLAPVLSRKFSAKITMVTGIFLGGVGLALLALIVSVEGGYLSVLPGLIIMGLGMGLSMTPSTEFITSSIPKDQQGVASAINDVTREFGTALGITFLGTLFTAGYSQKVGELFKDLPAEIIEQSREGLATVIQIANEYDSLPLSMVDDAKSAFVQAWQQSMWAGVAVVIALFLVIYMFGANNPAKNKSED